MGVLDGALDAVGGKDVPQGRILPARHEQGQILFTGRHHPTVPGIDLIGVVQSPAAQQLIDILVREIALSLGFGLVPEFPDGVIQLQHGGLFRNAGVGHSIEGPAEEILFGLRGQVSIVGDAEILVVRHQVEEILLQVGSGATDGVDLFLPNHLRQADPDLGGAHGPGQGHQHAAPRCDEFPVPVSRIGQGRRIEVAEVTSNKLADGVGFHGIWKAPGRP